MSMKCRDGARSGSWEKGLSCGYTVYHEAGVEKRGIHFMNNVQRFGIKKVKPLLKCILSNTQYRTTHLLA